MARCVTLVILENKTGNKHSPGKSGKEGDNYLQKSTEEIFKVGCKNDEIQN